MKIVAIAFWTLIGISVFDTIIQHKANPWVIIGMVSICAFDFVASLLSKKTNEVSHEQLKKDVDNLKNAVARVSLAVGFKVPEK